MTQHEALIDLFRRNGYRLTLSEILQYPFGYEFRARFTELRRQGYVILCERNGKKPSLNTYTMVEPEENGQMRFA